MVKVVWKGKKSSKKGRSKTGRDALGRFVKGQQSRATKKKSSPKLTNKGKKPRKKASSSMTKTDKYSQYFSFQLIAEAETDATQGWDWGTIEIPKTPDLFRGSGQRQTVLEFDKIEFEFDQFPMPNLIEEELEAAAYPRVLEVKWGLFYRPIQSLSDFENSCTYSSPACFWLWQKLYKYDPLAVVDYLGIPPYFVALQVRSEASSAVWRANSICSDAARVLREHLPEYHRVHRSVAR